MPIKMTILLLSAVGFLSQPGGNPNRDYSLGDSSPPGIRITPARICPKTLISIEQDSDIPFLESVYYSGPRLEMAVIANDGTFLELADADHYTTIPRYWLELKSEIRADLLFGVTFNGANYDPVFKPVFTKAGDYEFLFSDNLSIGPETTLLFTVYVEYLGPDHPDCPKPPFN